MTIVRRSSKCTNSCPTPGNSDFWDVISPSRQTVIKSETTKRYLENHFAALLNESEARRDRHQRIRDTIEKSSLEENDRKALMAEYELEETQYCRLSRARIKSARYNRIKMIGKGGFGQVWLVQDTITAELFALKVLKKADIILKDQLINVKTEREILTRVENPWLVKLQCSFQDSAYLYLVLEYIPGGDMLTALIRKGYFSEEIARFYIAEIALATESVHHMQFLHRDLKPDNVLIDENGHIKLTDFGLSTNYVKPDTSLEKLNDEIYEMMVEEGIIECTQSTPHHMRGNAIGTADYSAPEILTGASPTTASDVWSIGVILYEMLFGFTPFNGRSPQETMLRIVHWKRALRFPKEPKVSFNAIDLLQHLLCEPENRLTLHGIKSHPFFEGFDFGNYKRNQPPLIPVLRHPKDTSHFDDVALIEDDELPAALPSDVLSRFAFLGFTYKKRPQSVALSKINFEDLA